jgi:phosphoribosylformylglycinamidine synthase II
MSVELTGRGFRPEEAEAMLRGLGRRPNATEEALFRVLWSEHCSYKSSRAALRRLPTEGPQVAMGPGQNAGALRLGDGWLLAVKIESHNHPSAVEPFQGAATGLGGILRDILATGARPIAFLDALFFGDGPESAFHRRGVVAGIGHYGNAVGVPTVGGEWHEGPSYRVNPLVNCLAAGLVQEERLLPSAIPHEEAVLLLLGAPTGRDGLMGAAFASERLSGEDDAHRVEVQVGDPFLGKLLVEATIALAEEGLLIGLGDLGAAGLTSAVAEMAHRGGVGVDLDLDAVLLREEGMTAAEILLSESQERMLLVAEPGNVAAIMARTARLGVPCRLIGHAAAGHAFRAFRGGELVVDVPVDLLAGGCPLVPLSPAPPRHLAPAPFPACRPAELFAELCRRRPPGGPRQVYGTYDWAVGIRTVLGPGHDAAVLRVPEWGGHVALVTKSAARAAFLDARRGAALAVAWAALALAAVGARGLGITDGINLGAPEDGEVARDLDATTEGLAEAASFLELPVVSGNVSLYNSGPEGAVWPTLVVGAVGAVARGAPVGRSIVTAPGLVLAEIGSGSAVLAGTLAEEVVRGAPSGEGPPPELPATRALTALLLAAWADGLIEAAHTVDEGGLLLAVHQMTAAGGLSAQLDVPLDLPAAFGEAGGRVVVAYRAEAGAELAARARAAGLQFLPLGVSVRGEGRALVAGEDITLRGDGS